MAAGEPAAPASLSEKDRRRTTRLALALVFGWAALLWAWGYAARDRFPGLPRHGWAPDLERRAPPYARFDSGWYLGIAEHGYGPPPGPGRPSTHAFFPLYPLLVRGVSILLSLDLLWAGPLVSLVCALAAALLFREEGERRLGPAGSFSALAFLLLYPTSFFLLAMYSESLFLLLALLAFRFVAKERPVVAAVFALLAGWTRVTALTLAIPLALSAGRVESRGILPHRKFRASRALLVGLSPVVGVALWIFLIGRISGEPGVYFHSQQGWQRGASPFSGIAQWAEALPARIGRGDLRRSPGFLLDYAHALLFLAIGAYQALRRKWPDAFWTAGALLIPISTGLSASVPRYVLVVYPAFYALAELFEKRSRLQWIWWVGSAALLLAGAAAFVNWRWVA